MSRPFGCACRWQNDKGQVTECGTHRGERDEIGDALLALIPKRHRPLICVCARCALFRKVRRLPRQIEASSR